MSQPDANHDVAVIGGGVTGAASALAIASQCPHIRIALVEPSPAASSLAANSPPDLRVSALNLQSERFLRAIGAWQHLNPARLQQYRALQVSDSVQLDGKAKPTSASTRFSVADLGDTATEHLGYIVENIALQQALSEKLATLPNVSLLRARLTDIRQHESGCNIRLDSNDGHSHQLSCRVVIGADGANSQVRAKAGITHASEGYFQKALVIGVELDEAAGDLTWQAFRPQGPLAYLPLFERAGTGSQATVNYASLVWYDSPALITELLSLDMAALQQRVEESFPSSLPRLRRVYARASFPLAKSHCSRYSAGCVVLVGDAAHTINPLAGQGLNLGIQDAEALAASLAPIFADASRPADAVSIRNAFTAYEQTRKPQNLLMTAAIDLFYHVFSNEIGPLRLFRRFGLALADRSGPLKRRVLRHALGIDQATPAQAVANEAKAAVQ